MGTVPPTPNFSAGEFPTAAKMNQIQTALNFMQNPPRAMVYASAAQNNPTSAVWSAINFDAEYVDTDGMHDLVTNNSRVTFQTPGRYEINGQITYAANVTGRRAGRLIQNAAGGGNLGQTEAATATAAGGSTTTIVIPPLELTFVAGDFIELQGFQNSTAALAYGVGTYLTFLRAKWIGV